MNNSWTPMMMPRRAMSPCGETGCPELCYTPRCRVHTREAEKRWKDPSRQKVYQSRRWRGVRLQVLKEHPWCQNCGINIATDVDHVVALADDGDPYDRSNLQALCKRCHSSKTMTEIYRRKEA